MNCKKAIIAGVEPLIRDYIDCRIADLQEFSRSAAQTAILQIYTTGNCKSAYLYLQIAFFAQTHKCKSAHTKSARCNYQKCKWQTINIKIAMIIPVQMHLDV